MNNSNISQHIDDTIITVIDEQIIKDLYNTKFFHKCRTGRISKQEMSDYIIQQNLYSSHFTNYLCALMANLKSKEDVIRLTDNLCDELGLNDESKIPHYKLYENMASSMEIALKSQTELHTTKILIHSMMAYCQDNDSLKGLAALCFGAEAIVGLVYSQIIIGLEKLGFTDKKHLKFFTLHVQCDDEHGRTLYEIIKREIDNNPEKLEMVRSIAQDMVKKRINFFDEIINANSRKEKEIAA